MPALIPILVSAAGAAGAISTTLAAWLTIASTLTIGIYERDKAKRAEAKARRAFNDSIQDRLITVRSAVSPRRYVLGTVRTGGTLLYAETVGTDRTSLDSVTALCCNETTAVGYYIGDEFLTPAQFPGEKFGTEEQQAIKDAQDAIGDGSSLTYLTMTLSFVPSGTVDAFYTHAGARGMKLRCTVVSVVGTTLTVTGIGVEGPCRLFAHYNAASGVKLKLQFKNGSPDQETDDWSLVATPDWTANHRLSGVTYIRTLMVWDQSIYANGAPPIGAVLLGHAIEGHPFYDPRNASNPASTDNPAILAGWWMTMPRNRGGCGIPSGWIDWASVAIAASICDELITVRTLNGSSYEQIRRYRCNTVLSTENPPLDNLQIILSAMGGRRAFTAGKYKVLAGAFRSATLTITDADIVGTKPISSSSAGGDDAPANVVTASFADATKNWQESNPKPVINDSYVDLDGHESPADIRLQATTDPRLANYLMGVTLEALRPAFTVTLTVGGAGENIALYDTVQLSISNRPVFAGKTFEVMQITDFWNGEFELVLNEIRPQTWALDPDTFTPSDPITPPDLSYLWNVSPLTGMTVELGDPQILPDGNAITQVALAWNLPTALYVGPSGRIEVRYAEAGGEWISVAPLPGDSIGTTITASLIEGSNYLWQARVINGMGAASPWVGVWTEVEGSELAAGVQGPGIFTWANPVNVTTTSSSITKSAGGAAWNAGAHSLQSYSAGAFVTARPGETNASKMIALNDDPAVDVNFVGLNFAWRATATATLEIYESGILISAHGAYTINTIVYVGYDGVNVRYQKDGVVVRTVAASGLRLFADTSIFTVGGSWLDVAFGPMGGAGPAGAPGAAAQSVRLSATSYAFTYDSAGVASPAGQVVTFTTTRQNIPVATVWTTTPAGITLGGSGDTRTLSAAAFGANTSVRVTASASGFSDSITVVRLSQGATGSGGISGILTNESHTLAADPDGVVGSYAGANGLFLVYEGTTDRTSVATFSVTSASNCTVQINTAANTPIAGQPRGFYRVTAVTADQASATLQATYSGVTTPKVFTVVRARQGQPGEGQNLLPIDDWVVGTLGNQGSPARWLANDDSPGNGESRIVLAGSAAGIPLGPFGTSEALWECRSIDGSGANGDGGWNVTVGIDHRLTYRSTVWFRINQFSGHFYHGCDLTNTNDLAGGANPNPYFNGFGLGGPTLEVNQWYLAVGIVHGSGYPGASIGIAGIYDPRTGRKILNATEFRNAVGATIQTQRAYHFYDTSTATRQWMPKPRFEEINGSEPSIDALLGFQRSTPWIARGNCFAGTNTFAKVGGALNWSDSDISSVQSVDNCHLQCKAGQTTANFMVALNRDPLADMSYASLDAAWYWHPGGLQIYENGVLIGDFGAYTTSTELGWTLQDGFIRYYKDRALIRTIGPYPAGTRFYVDSSFYTPSATCTVKFGPGIEFETIGTSDLAPESATEIEHQFTAGPVTSTHGNTTVDIDTFPVGVMSANGTLVVTVTFDGRHGGSGRGQASLSSLGNTGGTSTGTAGTYLAHSTEDETYVLRQFVPVLAGDNVTLRMRNKHTVSGTPPGLTGTSTLSNIDYEVEFIKR